MDDMVNNLQLVMVNIWMILEVNISNLWYIWTIWLIPEVTNLIRPAWCINHIF